MSLAAFRRRWTSVGRQPSAPAPTLAPFPEPPVEGFVLFLYRAYVEAPRPDYQRIAAAWRHGLRCTEAWLRQHRGRVNEVAVADFLQSAVSGCNDLREAVCFLRGAQVAFFLDWWLVKLDTERFGRYARLTSSEDLERGGAQLLRGFINPARAAAGVIRAVSHAELDDIAAIAVTDVARDGSRLTVAGQRFAVPKPAQAIVRAQLYARGGSAGDDGRRPLFMAEDRSDAPASARVIHGWLRDATMQAGIHLVDSYTARSRPTERRWMYRRGLSLARLEE
jgi:hypothetical protein